MKTYIALFTVLTLLGTGLYLSDRHERVIFAEEIAWAQCAKITVFTYDRFLDETCTTTKIGRAKIKNNFLDLGKYGLPGLKDDAFVDYTCLQKANLSQNRFTTIPRALKDLVNLKELDLSNNKITDITPDDAIFSDLQNIKNYNFSKNQITVFDFLPKTEAYTSLDLGYNQIDTVDFSKIKYRSNIVVLNLNNNWLTSLDSALLYLPNLSELYLSTNAIDNIDYTLRTMLHNKSDISHSPLKKLSLYENELTAFPSLLGKVAPNLEILELQDNKISGPILIDGFNQLKNLVITSQKVSSFTIGEYGGQKLQEIDLSNNQIKAFTNDNRSSSEMQRIDLSYNQLTEFPYDALFFHYLKKLNLANNKLEGLIFLEKPHENLSDLDLSDNQIEDVYGLSNIQYLGYLNLRKNKIKDFEEITKTVNLYLRSLDLAFNELELFYLPENNFERLEVLNLMGNNLTRVGFDGGKALQKINLSHNYLKSIIFNKTPYFYKNLEEIDLSYNVYLTDFPLEALMKAAPNLKTIHLAETGIANSTTLRLKFQILANLGGINLVYDKE